MTKFRAVSSTRAAPLEPLLLQQQTGRVSEATPFSSLLSFFFFFFIFFFFFPLRFLLLDVTLCHSHSRSAALSISINAAPLGRGDTSKPLFVCERGLSLHQRGLPVCTFHARALCLCARVLVCVLCMRLCVFSVVFSSSTAIPLSAVCPSLKHQLVSEGPLGGKETTGRLHSFFHPHKDVPLLPVLSFFQEVLAGRGFFTLFHSLALW